MKSAFFASVLAATAAMTVGAYAATLDGDDVTAVHTGGYTPVFGPTDLVVGAGVELPIDLASGRTMNLDLGGNTVDLLFGTTGAGAAFGTYGFAFDITGIDFGTGITGIDVTFSESLLGTLPKGLDDIVTFTSNSLSINLQGTWEEGDNLSIALQSDVSAVPLPAGLPLLLGGMAAFGLIRRRG